MALLYVPRTLGGTLVLGSASVSPTIYVPRTLGGTLILGGAPAPTLPLFAPFTVGLVGGENVIPVLDRPQAPYAVGGTALPDQPYLRTAPRQTGNVIPAGALFTLLWAAPSPVTRYALADGSIVSLTFALPLGQMVTGPVAVSSTLLGDGSPFLVVCTLVSALVLNTRVVQTPFF